jgi:hypothetical protein
MNFEEWLANLLGQRAQDVQRLLKDETALHFLIAWSLFESKCFSGFLKLIGIETYCERLVGKERFDSETVAAQCRHFHDRYQDVNLYRHLMHKQRSPRMDAILKRAFETLTPEDKLFLLAVTIYRYRNNIFHGNKGVDSWLRYRPQIKHCIAGMQAFVDHAERLVPSLNAAT